MKFLIHLKRCAFYSTLLLAGLMVSANAYAAQIVKKIEISGVQRIEESTVASYMDLKVGDPVDNKSTDRALKSLFSTGLFADVKVQQVNGLVSVYVVENPVINVISFEGNDAIENEELLAEVQLRQRQVFTRSKVQSDVSRLYQIYRRQGRFSVSIQPQIIRLDQNRVNLVFEIHEGGVTKIKSVRFVGNKNYSDGKLRSIISTKESAWYKFMSSGDRYDADRLSYDKDLLRDYYQSQGYADFKILSAVAELSNDKDSFFITFTVEEGQRYKIEGTEILSSLEHFDETVLNQAITFDVDDWYDADEVTKTVQAMTDQLGDLQYAFVDVRPDIRKNREDQAIIVVFAISETPRVFVERINVNGNIRTLDKVLRRELEVVEGDPFNRAKIAKSEQNIKNINFFENVNLRVSQGSAPDKTVIDIDVQEKSTGELSIGAGFSSSDGPLADISIRERNLLGKGQNLALSMVLAGEKSQVDFSFTEPYFLGRDISAGIDLFHVQRDLQDESSYDQTRTGGGLRVGYPLSENWRQTIRYKISRNEITDVGSDASRFIRDQEGKRTTLALSQRLFYDTRDSSILTTSGMTYWLDTELAGLGGDAKYVSAKTGASYYYPLAERWSVNMLAEVGGIQAYGDSDVEINERYFLGGSTLRGFARAGVGPRDGATDDSLGGNYFYRGSVETSFPIGLGKELGIKGHAFTDFGSLWDIDETGSGIFEETSLRATAGLGLSWKSPFGPIRVDFAVPYLQEDFDEEEHFRFDFGTRF
ncbi:MAG: outer membrane protein assembly factor BamA [Alphaproteobacteria bacterium]|nr:MAG: outer membrane protein assembly factor BamA [Alphaproteobacteria bacterium]